MEECALICLPGVVEIGVGALQCDGMCRDQQFSKFPESSDAKDDVEIYTEIYEDKKYVGHREVDGFRGAEHDETDGRRTVV